MTIYVLQYLRALAALMVVFHHSGYHYRIHQGVENANLFFGAMGVDIFFVISGFIMCHTTAVNPTTSLEFLKRRLERIVPLYWISTLSMFIMPNISPTIAFGAQSDFSLLMASLFFLPLPGSLYSATYGPGWTINYEMFFYVAFSLFLLTRSHRATVLGLGGLLAGLVVVSWVSPVHGIIRFYTSSILLEFLYGIIIALLFYSKRILPRFMALMAICAGAAVFFYVPYLDNSGMPFRFIIWGLPAALIVFGSISLENVGVISRSAIFEFLGDASYSIYLTHLFAIGAVAVVLNKAGILMKNIGLGGFIFIAMAAAILVSITSYLVIERPAVRFFKSRRRSPSIIAG
jgi:exopolysaccharide production protein ExoZ